MKKTNINIFQKKFLLDRSLTKEKNNNKKQSIYDISSFTGAGIPRLLNEIHNKTAKKTEEMPVLSRERHIKIMKNILKFYQA